MRSTMKETKNKNSALINQYKYGYNKVHMKTYEQRGHNSNKGDIFAYDGIYRLTGVKFISPEPSNPASEQFEKQKTITFDKLRVLGTGKFALIFYPNQSSSSIIFAGFSCSCVITCTLNFTFLTVGIRKCCLPLPSIK